MRTFDVQGIEISAAKGLVFDFVKEPANLPKWARAFTAAGDGRARLETPAGAVDVGLAVSGWRSPESPRQHAAAASTASC